MERFHNSAAGFLVFGGFPGSEIETHPFIDLQCEFVRERITYEFINCSSDCHGTWSRYETFFLEDFGWMRWKKKKPKRPHTIMRLEDEIKMRRSEFAYNWNRDIDYNQNQSFASRRGRFHMNVEEKIQWIFKERWAERFMLSRNDFFKFSAESITDDQFKLRISHEKYHGPARITYEPVWLFD